MTQRRQHPLNRRRLAALTVAGLLHAAVVYVAFSAQNLQFSHSSAAHFSEQGVMVMLVAPASPPQPVPPSQTQPVQPAMPRAATALPKSAPVATTARADLPSLIAQASPSAAPESAPPTAAVSTAAPPQAALSARAEVPTLPGAAEPTTQALACQVPQPPYPPRAKRLRETGTVVLRLNVTASGAIEGAEIAKSSGSESLDQAALGAVRAARCKPGLTDGIATAIAVAVPVQFSLLN